VEIIVGSRRKRPDGQWSVGVCCVFAEGPNTMCRCNIERLQDGRRRVTYTPVEVGTFTITITWNRRDIPGAPNLCIFRFKYRPVGRKWNGGGVFFYKKWTFPQRRVHYVQYQYFFVLHFTYLGGAYVPNAPPCVRAWSTIQYDTRCSFNERQKADINQQ